MYLDNGDKKYHKSFQENFIIEKKREKKKK